MFVRTPIGPQARRWRTLNPARHVLIVAHNVTSMTRLLDVLPLFEGDFRIQLSFGWNNSDPFSGGLLEIDAPIVSLPHGIRYTKYLPRKTERAGRKVFGALAPVVALRRRSDRLDTGPLP